MNDVTIHLLTDAQLSVNIYVRCSSPGLKQILDLE